MTLVNGQHYLIIMHQLVSLTTLHLFEGNCDMIFRGSVNLSFIANTHHFQKSKVADISKVTDQGPVTYTFWFNNFASYCFISSEELPAPENELHVQIKAICQE